MNGVRPRGRRITARRKTSMITARWMGFVAALAVFGSGAAITAPGAEAGWPPENAYASLEEASAAASREQKPLLLDFFAEW